LAATAAEVDRVEVDDRVELLSSSAPLPPSRQQIGGQRHAAKVPRLSLLLQWWLAATMACRGGGRGSNGFVWVIKKGGNYGP